MAHYSGFEDSHAAGRVFADEVAQAEPTEGVYRRHLKRMLDLMMVAVAAPVVAPLVVIFALLVALDGGSAFYVHDRIGRNGRVFRLWKLRTMVPDADRRLATHLAQDLAARAEWNERQKLRNDPRITWMGRILRKTSLDELPQLWNILRGDMSVVGPRPMMPDQMPLYPGRDYYQLRPGLTGFWQVSDRNQISFAGRALHDTQYAERMSFMTDLIVIVMTIRVVLRGTGY